MPRYRSRPSVVEAVQWTGDNFAEVQMFAEPPEGRHVVRKHGRDLQTLAGKDGAQGWVDVPVGHWIVRQPGDLTDHWPVADDYFTAKYEPDTFGYTPAPHFAENHWSPRTSDE